MEIQKIFSDMYDEERIYSVLMNEDELRLYAEVEEALEEEVEPKRGWSTAAKVGAGLGTAAALAGAGYLAHRGIKAHNVKKIRKAAENAFRANKVAGTETAAKIAKELAGKKNKTAVLRANKEAIKAVHNGKEAAVKVANANQRGTVYNTAKNLMKKQGMSAKEAMEVAKSKMGKNVILYSDHDLY